MTGFVTRCVFSQAFYKSLAVVTSFLSFVELFLCQYSGRRFVAVNSNEIFPYVYTMKNSLTYKSYRCSI